MRPHPNGRRRSSSSSPRSSTPARIMVPGELRNTLRGITDALDGDGGAAEDEAQLARRRFHISKTLDGMYAFDGLCDGEDGESIKIALDADHGTRPRPGRDPHPPATPDGRVRGNGPPTPAPHRRQLDSPRPWPSQRDLRPRGLRRHRTLGGGSRPRRVRKRRPAVARNDRTDAVRLPGQPHHHRRTQRHHRRGLAGQSRLRRTVASPRRPRQALHRPRL